MGEGSARELLDRRLAAGEITIEQYDELRARIAGSEAGAERPVPREGAGLPENAAVYLAAWRRANVALVVVIAASAFLVPKVILPYVLDTGWGMRLFAWLSSIAGAIIGSGPGDRSFALALLLVATLATQALSWCAGSMVLPGFLHARDTAATALPPDVDRLIRTQRMGLSRVEVLEGRPGITLRPQVTNGFMWLNLLVFLLVWYFL